MDKWQNTLIAVARLLVAAVLCAAVVCSLLAFSLQAVFDSDVYGAAAETDAFVAALHTEVSEHLESECLFYDLPYDTVKEAMPVQTVQAVARERMAAVYDTLCRGTKLPAATLDPAPFKAAIDSFFETLPAEERPLDVDASKTIAGELAESTALVMSIGISDKLLASARPLFADVSPLRRVADAGAWILLTVVVLAALSLIPLKSTWRQRAYTTASTLFIGSAVVAVPMWLFVGLDLPSKIAIGDSALREYVNAVLYTVFDRANAIATAAFIVSAVLLIAAVVWLVTNKNKKTAH